MITNKRTVLVEMDNPNPIAYFNVYEEGDIWVKTQGCEACSLENRRKCCGNCPMFSEQGCFFHLQKDGDNKPYRCVVRPEPDICLSWCALEFECIQGSKKGFIRRIKDRGNEFIKK